MISLARGLPMLDNWHVYMKARDLQDMLQKTPFQPFDVCLDHGQSLCVEHPDCILFSRRKTSCVLAEGAHFRFVDLDRLSSMR